MVKPASKFLNGGNFSAHYCKVYSKCTCDKRKEIWHSPFPVLCAASSPVLLKYRVVKASNTIFNNHFHKTDEHTSQ